MLRTPRNPRWWCKSALDRAGFPHTMRRVYTLRRKFQLKNNNLRFDRNKCPIGFLLFLKHTRHLRRLRILRSLCLSCRPELDPVDFLRTMHRVYTRHHRFRLKNNNLQFDRNKCPIESRPILKRMCRFRTLRIPRNPRWWSRSALDRAGFLRTMRPAYTRHRKFLLKNNNLQFDRNKCPIESQPILIHTCHFRRLHTPRNPRWLCRSALDRAGFLRRTRRAYTRSRKFRLKNSNLQFDRNKCPIESQPILKRTCRFRTLRTLHNPRWLYRSGMASEGFRLHLLRHRYYHRRHRPQAQFLRQQSKPLRYRCLFSRRCLNLPRLEHKSPKIIHRLVCKIDQPLNRWSARTCLLCKHCLTGFLNY